MAVAILGLSCFNAYLGYDAQRTLSDYQQARNTVYEDLLLLGRVQQMILDAETGQRGYLLTRQPSYREPYDSAIVRLNSTLSELNRRLALYHQINPLVPALNDAIDAKTQELAEVLRFAEANDAGVGEKIAEGNEDQRYMENIRAAVESINAALRAEADALESAGRSERNRALTSLGLAAVASVVLLLALVGVARSDAVRREQMSELLVRQNERLDDAVRHRTRELEVANEQFDRSNRELENFAYVVSHDLQEPLRKIRAFGDRLMLTQQDKLEPRARDYLERMHSAAARMSTLLEDLLTFSRVNTRGLEIVDIDLNRLIATVLDDLEVAIEEKNAAIEIDDGLPVIRGDWTQLRQLFQNLIANALKFQAEDRDPRIHISSVAVGGDGEYPARIRIDIRDNGIGFEERYLDRIFAPFQRLNARHEYAGSGIGLAICRRVAERHEGMLTATSTPGEGAIFSVTLPTNLNPPKETTHAEYS